MRFYKFLLHIEKLIEPPTGFEPAIETLEASCSSN